MRKPSRCLWAWALAAVAWAGGYGGEPASGQSGPAPVFPNAADPNYEKVYSQHRQEVQGQPIVAPALGYSGAAPAAGVRQTGLGSGLGGVADSMKKGVGKVGDFFTPEERVQKAAEPTSIYNNSKPGPETFVAMARLHAEAGRLLEAERQYVNALRANPKHLGALLGYAHLKDRAGQANDALQLYQQAAAAHPNEAAVFNDMGLCYARNGQLNPAAAHLGRAVQIQPKKALYRNNLAIVLVEMGQTEQALAQLRAVNPEPVARFNLGHLLLRKGDSGAAAEQFALAHQADPAMVQAKAWLDELARNGVQTSASEDRVAAWNRAQARRGAAGRAVAPSGTAPAEGPLPSAPPPQTHATPAPSQARPGYGNFPVPQGRLMAPRRPGEAPLPSEPGAGQSPASAQPDAIRPLPAPAQATATDLPPDGPRRVVAPEPAADGATWPPMLMGPPRAPRRPDPQAGPSRNLPQLLPPEAGAEVPAVPEPPSIDGPPTPGEQEAIAPLPPVSRPEPPVESLPPVEDAPLP